MRRNDAFARALVYMIGDGPIDATYALADRLRRERGARLNDFGNLAAAVCVVHDRPLTRKINENTAAAPDPVIIFDYYSTYEKRMYFGVRDVPAELLVHVVDIAASVDEMMWALNRYAGDPLVGARFFDVPYDFEHFEKGAPKRVTLAGWTLPNILQHGGVCADQAHFASTVGKAIGVPAVYVVGQSGDLAHAWVGFLQSGGKNVWWNFDAGRYEAYQGVKGIILDPDRRAFVPDSRIGLLAEFSLRTPAERRAAAAFTDAVRRVQRSAESGAAFPPPRFDVEGIGLREPRPPGASTALALLEQGLRQCPGYADAWLALEGFAKADDLSYEDKERWAGVLDRLCGKRYPDFSLSILIPMIESVDDIAGQNDLWNAAFDAYRGRHDLAAEVRMHQGRMWEKAGDLQKAGQCFEDVIQRYANAGPFVLEAVARAEALLRAAGRERMIPALYAQTWSRIRRPEQMAGQFAVQSNWYRLGLKYAEVLDAVGQPQEASQVRAAIRPR
jgi:hypothetical protein